MAPLSWSAWSVHAWRIHGQRSLVGYSPRGRTESDTPERLCTYLLRVQLLSVLLASCLNVNLLCFNPLGNMLHH